MSDRPHKVVCEEHQFSVRIGILMPCPWPDCRNGAKHAEWRKHVVKERLMDITPADQADYNTVLCFDTVIYEAKRLAISGDGMISILWTWTRRGKYEL